MNFVYLEAFGTSIFDLYSLFALDFVLDFNLVSLNQVRNSKDSFSIESVLKEQLRLLVMGIYIG